MGPCVRLIRALGPRPELNEEEKRARWSAFKNKVKTEGLGLREVKIGQSIDPDRWDIIRVGAMKNPSIDNEEMLGGRVLLTYPDGKTEEAQCVHHGKRVSSDSHLSVATTLLSTTKEIHGVSSCIHRSPIYCPQGTSKTIAADGTQTLGVIARP